MTTGTAATIPAPRQDPRQVTNTLKKTVNYNDAGIASGLAFDNSLPAGAFITKVLVEIVTAFDGTPALTVGTNSTSFNDIVADGDVDETSAGMNIVDRALGRGIAASADKVPYVKLTATNPSQGQAVIVIEYEGGWSA